MVHSRRVLRRREEAARARRDAGDAALVQVAERLHLDDRHLAARHRLLHERRGVPRRSRRPRARCRSSRSRCRSARCSPAGSSTTGCGARSARTTRGSRPRCRSRCCSAPIYGFSQMFSGRAAYIQTGVLIGTIMTGNVWLCIMPSQRSLIAATKSGKRAGPGAVAARQAAQHPQQLPDVPAAVHHAVEPLPERVRPSPQLAGADRRDGRRRRRAPLHEHALPRRGQAAGDGRVAGAGRDGGDRASAGCS